MKTALAILALVLASTACQSCRTPGDQPASPVVTAAVTCGAPAAAELISDATAALASLDSEWKAHLTTAATKYGAEALNCALQQMLAGWASSRSISAAEHRSVERASEWLATSAGQRALSPQLTCSQCWSLCHGAGSCFNCCCLHQC